MGQTMTLPQRPRYGLYNQGTTCYLNSVLQVLSMTPEMHNRLGPRSPTDKTLTNVFKNLQGRNCGTEDITHSLGITNVYEQRDAAECLELILGKISSRASEVFQGQLAYTTKCDIGHSINEETNPFWILPLSLNDAHDSTYSVERSFKRISLAKALYGDNMVYCNQCERKTKAETVCEMVKHPRILTVLLKRFYFDHDVMSHVKSDRYVDVPRQLQIKGKMYKLYGMVDHMGSLRGGHYTATILFDGDKTWYKFDDAYVNKIQPQPFPHKEMYKSRTVYLLMYKETNSADLTDQMGGRKDEDIDGQNCDEVSIPPEETPKCPLTRRLDFIGDLYWRVLFFVVFLLLVGVLIFAISWLSS